MWSFRVWIEVTNIDDSFCSRDYISPDSPVPSSLVVNVTRQYRRIHIFPTLLRQNLLYYRIYCIGLNTAFATVLPLLSLLWLNTRTVMGLRAIRKQEEESAGGGDRALLQKNGGNGAASTAVVSSAPRAPSGRENPLALAVAEGSLPTPGKGTTLLLEGTTVFSDFGKEEEER